MATKEVLKKRARDPTTTATTSINAQEPVFPASEARANFMEVINRVRFGRERLVVTNKGKPAAALVSMEDLALLRLLDDVDIKEKLHGRIKEESTAESISLDEYDRRRASRAAAR